MSSPSRSKPEGASPLLSRSERAAASPPRSAPPKLDFDLEQGAFRLLRALWRRLAPTPAAAAVSDPNEVRLEDHLGALRVVAQLIAEAPLELQAARSVGGVRGLDLLLPARVGLAPSPEINRRLLLVRTAVSAALHRLDRGEPIPAEPTARLLESLRRSLEAVDWLCDALPGFRAAHDEALHWCLAARPSLEQLEGREQIHESLRRAALRGERPWHGAEREGWLERIDALDERGRSRRARRRGASSPPILIWGELIGAPARDPAAAAKQEDAGTDDELPPAASASEFEAPPVDELLRIELDPKQQEDAVLIHTFEKVETADEYRGGARDTDGADELADQLEALEEVDLRELLRGGEQAHSMLRSTLSLDAEIPQVGACEPGEEGLAYDEWDTRQGAYRKDWCTVYPTRFDRIRPDWANAARTRRRALIRDLTRRLGAYRARREALDRQPDGEDIDLRAVVDEHAARRAGHGGNLRLYTRRAKRRRDFATTVLLDVSLSSDSWVDGRRVLDVARDAAFVLGEVAETFGDRLQILAFASHTRNHCRVWELRGWREPWEIGSARLGAIEPQGYTRIGPALRHATAQLAAEPADARLLLLLSDGKPTDYDRYEGRYGIADVRQALREAEQLGITTHALAVDRVACSYLPAMFGSRAWHILPDPEQLPEVLTTVYGRLTNG